jgi:hypothetical protein
MIKCTAFPLAILLTTSLSVFGAEPTKPQISLTDLSTYYSNHETQKALFEMGLQQAVIERDKTKNKISALNDQLYQSLLLFAYPNSIYTVYTTHPADIHALLQKQNELASDLKYHVQRLEIRNKKIKVYNALLESNQNQAKFLNTLKSLQE